MNIFLTTDIKLVGSIQLEEGYSYNVISITNSTVLAREFYTDKIILYDFSGHKLSEMKLKTGRGPGEVAMTSVPIKANSKFVFVLDRVSHKVLKYSLDNLEYLDETLTPNAPWALVANNEVYIRSTATPQIYHNIRFTEHDFVPLQNSDWTEPYNRFMNIFAYEAYDIATNEFLIMAKTYDTSYYLYDLKQNNMKLIRYEDTDPTDFSDSDFMGSLKVHVLNASLFEKGTHLGFSGKGRGGQGRVYNTDTIHLFDLTSGQYIKQISIPGVEIAQNSLVSNESHFAFIDIKSNQIRIYSYVSK